MKFADGTIGWVYGEYIRKSKKNLLIKKINKYDIKNAFDERAIYDSKGNLIAAGRRLRDNTDDMVIVKKYDKTGKVKKVFKSKYIPKSKYGEMETIFQFSENKKWIGEFYLVYGDPEAGGTQIPMISVYDKNGNKIYSEVELPEEIRTNYFLRYKIGNSGDIIFLYDEVDREHPDLDDDKFFEKVKCIYMYNIKKRKLSKIIFSPELKYRQRGETMIGSSPDGEYYAANVVPDAEDYRNMKLYFIYFNKDGRIIWKKKGLRGYSYFPVIKFSPDGKYISTEGGYLFDRKGNILLSQFRDNVFTRDGRYLYAVYDNIVKRYDTETGEVIKNENKGVFHPNRWKYITCYGVWVCNDRVIVRYSERNRSLDDRNIFTVIYDLDLKLLSNIKLGVFWIDDCIPVGDKILIITKEDNGVINTYMIER